MTPIPPKIRKQIDTDPFYKICALTNQHDHVCAGRITIDHSIIYQGKQLQEIWALTPVCERGHGVDSYAGSDTARLREMRLWVSLNRADQKDLIRISKAVNYIRELDRLNKKYGVYMPYFPAYRDLLK